MKNIIFALLAFCFYSTSTKAQSLTECKRSLQYASTYFSQNNYRACIRTLNERCFTTSYLDSEMNVKKSYKIKIESLRAVDYDFEADELYKKFEKWILKNNLKPTNKTIPDIFKEINTS